MDRVKCDSNTEMDKDKVLYEIYEVFRDTFGDGCIHLSKNCYYSFYKIK